MGLIIMMHYRYLEGKPCASPSPSSPSSPSSPASPSRKSETLTQSNNDESKASPHDSVGRMMGPDHYERVLTMGMGVVPTNTYRNTTLRASNFGTSSSSSYNDWRERCNNMESTFKSYIIMEE
ncbi:unnamed protein product [Lupinus luteus]|uniref:Uncharacterized protein n=1 Tax=Lupinus luteus TaxID=3873 RepID=A0AAV1VRF5_LUPLU